MSSRLCEQKGVDVINKITRGPIPKLLLGAVSCLAMTTPLACAAPQVQAPKHVGAAGRTEFPAQFVARAISVSGPESAGRIDIYVERWSTDEELARLLGTLEEGGPGELLTVL